ncbi:sugar phosphate isomerase/epimerase [Halalkalibacterium halodurans]|uniref:sugar phosphate isomerase/epimerase family protein n=1 Tax=Halalkalibacterium halodurans TaxID=86665 RepID=UPI001067C01F|nr:sugar phosphate isomerase/epimerase [Halalkalibacterium halodurans]TES53749.1 sugar phosphate isomerase/epimerase [Halalkalibacterium halodurans]
MKNQIALQLYTVRKPLEEDFEGTLRKVASIGFQGVELADDWGGKSPEALKAILQSVGLVPVSSHVALERLENQLDDVIDYHLRLGCHTIYCPYLEEERQTATGYKELITSLKEIQKKLEKKGISFGYHHHDFELYSNQLEAILSIPSLLAELDVYWLQKAGQDPVEWVSRYKHKVRHVHLKDMTNDDQEFFAPVGTGKINIDAILESSTSFVEWWIVEQDDGEGNPLVWIEKSYTYVNERL